MDPLWLTAAVGLLLAALGFGVPWLLNEYFPWRNIYKQRHGRPTVRTESYAGRSILVTGAAGAFGSRAAKMFAERGAKRLVLVDVSDCSRLKDEIEAELEAAGNNHKPDILVWQIDLMTFAGCQKLRDLAKDIDGFDHALLTVGILAFKRRESSEGWETSIQVNYLSTALVALFLLPKMKSAPTNPHAPVITFVTSFGIWPSSFTMGMPSRGSYLKKLSTSSDGPMQAHQYGRSKALLLYFARELADRVSRSKGLPAITINSGDPGSSWTPLTNPNGGMLIPRMIMNFSARDPQFGAAALVNSASAAEDSHGKIVHDFDMAEYPAFMDRKSGQVAQKRVWDETRQEFEAKAPEIKEIYEMLG